MSRRFKKIGSANVYQTKGKKMAFKIKLKPYLVKHLEDDSFFQIFMFKNPKLAGSDYTILASIKDEIQS